MKKLICIVVVVILAVYAWKKYDLGQYINSVKVPIADLKDKEDTAQKAVQEHNDARRDLFQIMVLMNEVTINTMKLEQMGEGKNLGSDQLPMKLQLEEKMKLLKEQLAEAREYAKENAELTAEVERLQNSFLQREQTIRRLAKEDDDLDVKIQAAIDELESETNLLREENQKLVEKNAELRTVIGTRKQAELNAWMMAGDELVEAARTIPRANSKLIGNQSIEITRSKQMILKSATECYNNATKLGNSYSLIKLAATAHDRAREADRLFNCVTRYESIGEID